MHLWHRVWLRCRQGLLHGQQVLFCYIEAEIKLTGITVAQFDATAKSNFKSVIAASMTGVKASDVYDVKATAATRRAGVKVSFKVKVATAAAASSGATTLNTFLKDTTGANGFLKKLQAKGGALANVSGVTVTKAPAAKTSVTVSGVANTAILSIMSFVALSCALSLRVQMSESWYQMAVVPTFVCWGTAWRSVSSCGTIFSLEHSAAAHARHGARFRTL